MIATGTVIGGASEVALKVGWSVACFTNGDTLTLLTLRPALRQQRVLTLTLEGAAHAEMSGQQRMQNFCGNDSHVGGLTRFHAGRVCMSVHVLVHR